MSDITREPTARIQPASADDDTPPPPPPHELPAEGDAEQAFETGGQKWLARVSGKSAYGTGTYGLGLLEAVHFYHADQPETPLREALLARGQFSRLYDVELIRLLETAKPIVLPAEGGASELPRGGGRSRLSD